MESNPYLPPASPVDDASGARGASGPPRGIVRAAWMLRFLILGSLPISTIVFVSSSQPGELILLGGAAMVLPALFLALSWPLLRGRNWARIVTTVGAALFLAYAGETVFILALVARNDRMASVEMAVLGVLAVLIGLQAIGICAATAWLWGRSARRWFRERRAR